MSDNRTNMAMGAGLGVLGMSAYHMPITKNRFVRNAFSVTKDMAEDKLELLNDSALELTKRGELSGDKAVFLRELGVSEDLDSISRKCSEIKKTITDPDSVKSLKKSFADSFKDMKKNEALIDNVSEKAFSKIRWTNFWWGAGIGFVLGNVLGAIRSPNRAE